MSGANHYSPIALAPGCAFELKSKNTLTRTHVHKLKRKFFMNLIETELFEYGQ